MRRGSDRKLDLEQIKAWAQNMGHDKPLTTVNSYGYVSVERQAEIIGALAETKKTGSASLEIDLEKKINEIHAMLKDRAA